MLLGRKQWLDRASPEVTMGSVGPTQLIALLVAVAVIAATSGFVASTVALKKKRARKFFALGFLCGFVANPIVRRRRRGAFDRATTVLRAYRRHAHY
jgi:hypothetical protein